MPKSIWSPELQKLKKGYMARDYQAPAGYETETGALAKRLGERVEVPIGLSERERKGIFGLGRRQVAGAVQRSMGNVREALAGSNLAETGIGQRLMISEAAKGREQLGQYGTQIALDEAKRRHGESMALEQLNLQRAQAAGGLYGGMSTMEGARLGWGLQAGQFGAGMEMKEEEARQRRIAQQAAQRRWKEQFASQQTQQAISNLMGYRQTLSREQQAGYAPYYAAQSQAYGTQSQPSDVGAGMDTGGIWQWALQNANVGGG